MAQYSIELMKSYSNGGTYCLKSETISRFSSSIEYSSCHFVPNPSTASSVVGVDNTTIINNSMVFWSYGLIAFFLGLILFYIVKYILWLLYLPFYYFKKQK